MPKIKNPLDVYALVPKTNCGSCYLPSCLAFAAAVIKGDKKLSDCPFVKQKEMAQFDGKLEKRISFDEQREEILEDLKTKISSIDISTLEERLGARFVGEKLVIKSLGKNFLIDNHGNVTSECHTHSGLTIPLLSHIIQSKGGELSGQWVHFRELKNGAPMSPLFSHRGEKSLRKLADLHTDLFEILIDIFSGERSRNDFGADVSLLLYPLPKMPVLICYWKPEDDLESKLNIFFDSTAENHLSIESIYGLTIGLVMMFEKIAQRHA